MKIIKILKVLPCVILITIKICFGLYEDCDKEMYIGAYDTDSIHSPQFPFYYPVNSSCRYKIKAPSGYLIQATCLLYLEKTGSLCEREIFRVSSDDETLNNGEIFCGLNYFKRHSLFNELYLGYTSSGKKGVYKCYIKSLPQVCDCGWTVNTKIVGGNEPEINQYPSVAAIVDINWKRAICSATIINYRYLLSAASCFYNEPDIYNFRAYIGDHDISSSTETPYNEVYEISRVILHPDFDSTNIVNDITILETTIDITWKRGVGPACLPYNYIFNQFENNTVDIAGWGNINSTEENSVDIIKRATVDVFTNASCEVSNICTFKDGSRVCEFNSGSPLFYLKSRQYIVGITTAQIGCSFGITQNVRITPYIWWIYNNTNVNYCIK